jgi:hypothetical protein
MFKNIVFGLVAVVLLVVVVLAIVIAMQPSEFHVERSLTMKAPPEAAFAQVNDFQKWEKWSPWLKIDPNVKKTYEGPSSGEGAIFRWAGNAEVGEGSMTILESKPNEHVRIKLDFLKPLEGTATTDLTLNPTDGGTTVNWSMDGTNNFLAKAMCLFVFDMDKMIGDKYEEGLAKMKQIVESAPTESVPVEAAPSEASPAEPAAESAPAGAPSET